MSKNNPEQQHSKNPFDYSWKTPELLARFVTETGKILQRKYTRLTAKQQRHVTTEIKRARNMLTMQ
jgi:small subunit ribosomal protein S18